MTHRRIQTVMARHDSHSLLIFCCIGVLVVPFRAAVASETPPSYPPLPSEATRQFDRAWARMQRHEPGLEVRAVYNFLLTVAARGWRPEKLSDVIDLAESLHDRDPASPTYGNYRWYWRDPAPNDLNAVEFSMQAAGLAWLLYRDRLPDSAREKLRAALLLGSEGMLRQRVDVSYTNIFLMRLANCILIGEAAGRPDLVQRGRAWLDEWFAYTRTCGIHEFSSPTYYGVDVADLGALARYAREPAVRAQAEAALRLFWTDIAANWFAPCQGIAGAHSRDYGFLTGHGYLDQHLLRAHWIDGDPGGESRPVLDDLTHWDPPPELRAAVGEPPRRVAQQWGRNAWERATHYVGRHFSLGTAGAGYGPQDKILALTLAGGPKMPIVNFSLDHRRDPYGQEKTLMSDGHLKLTHLVPFAASVQCGPEALLLAAYDPAGKGKPASYAGVWATVVLPTAVKLWTGDRLLEPNAASIERPVAAGTPIFLRYQDTAAMIRFVLALDDVGQPAKLVLAREGDTLGAQRLAAVLAEGRPRARVMVALWVRAAENLDDDGFASFRQACLQANQGALPRIAGDRLDVSVPGLVAPLHIAVDLRSGKRLAIEGADPAMEAGILNVNGRDLGGVLLR